MKVYKRKFRKKNTGFLPVSKPVEQILVFYQEVKNYHRAMSQFVATFSQNFDDS